jgi:hypothetical protein
MSSLRAMSVTNYHVDELRLRRGPGAGRAMMRACFARDREQVPSDVDSVVMVAMAAGGRTMATASDHRDTWRVLVVGRVVERASIASRHGGAAASALVQP